MKTYAFRQLLHHLIENPDKGVEAFKGQQYIDSFRSFITRESPITPKEELEICDLFELAGYTYAGEDSWKKLGD